jgi:carbon-monoxide dehydrogenase medium subunit
LEYHRPSSLSAACRLLRGFGEEGLPLAGGTDVLVDLRRGTKAPRHVVSLSDVHELKGIRIDDGKIRIGSLVTPFELEGSEAVAEARPELLDVVTAFGTPQVRYRATIGGNLCTAASCGDMAPLLMALCARVVLAGPEGRREISLESFFKHHRETGLRPGEILAEVILPVRAPGDGAAYKAFGRRAANFITVAGVAALVEMQDGACAKARIALGAVFPTPLLVQEAEVALVGSDLDDESIAEAAKAARAAAAPISDVRGSAEHRLELVEVLTGRALRAAKGRALGEGGAS